MKEALRLGGSRITADQSGELFVVRAIQRWPHVTAGRGGVEVRPDAEAVVAELAEEAKLVVLENGVAAQVENPHCAKRP
jgi:hypothetical protein